MYYSDPDSRFVTYSFTGHEHLDDFDLINMNGRMYDPLLAMFLSPDNFVQSPGNTQNLNRYAYCLNNPLVYTDPDGEWFFSLLFTLGCSYLGGVTANNWEFNPIKWDYTNFSTWTGMLNGGISGYVLGSKIDYSVYRWITKKQRIAIQDMTLLEHNAKYSTSEVTDFPYFDKNGNLIPGDKTLDAFSDRYFSKYKYKNRSILKHNDNIFVGDHAKDMALTNPLPINDNYIINFHTRSFKSMRTLYYTMGHEYVHVAHLIELNWNSRISEYAAYKFGADCYYNLGGYSKTGDEFMKVALKKYYGKNTFDLLYNSESNLVLQLNDLPIVKPYIDYRRWGLNPFFPTFH